MNLKTYFMDGKLAESTKLVLIYSFFVITIAINISPFFEGRRELMDFGSFYAAGLKIQNGENPYDPNSGYIFDIYFPRVGAGGKMMNLNPPISVLIFERLARYDPSQAMKIWQISSAILYAFLVILLAGFYRQNTTPIKFIWAFTLAGFWHTLALGQIYIPLLLFTVAGWLLMQGKRYLLAGLAIGLVIAIKPNFILWAVFLLFSGYYLTFLVAGITSLAVSIIPIFFYGVEIYTQWLEASTLQIETLIMPGNNSILGLTARFNATNTGIVLSIFAAAVLLVISRQNKPGVTGQLEYISALGIIASLLASPISWTGYTILLLPVLFSIRKWEAPVIGSAFIFSIPFGIVLNQFQNSFWQFVVFGWLYGWGILLLLGGVFLISRHEQHDDEDQPNKLIHL